MNKKNEKLEKEKNFINDLLNWYSFNKRNYFFWRKTKNPYYILVSEMMLQKTTTKQVQDLINFFINKYPTPEELATAKITDIEKLIRPLGLEHKRAKNLKNSALIIKEKYAGKIPNNENDLMTLPGVGQYIANSVLCLGFGKQVPLLDTNIIRIIERVFRINSTKTRPRTDKKLWNYVKELTPEKRAREINLALLDFGALVCTAKKPKCQKCSMRDICLFYNAE